MSNPYDQARDDARSGRGLTPGADEGVYWAERRAREENQTIKEGLERRGNSGSLPSFPEGDHVLPPTATNLTPEQARAGLIGLVTLPVAVALSPLLIALYPAAALAGALVGFGAWQVSQLVSPGGGAFTGLIVGGVALVAAAIGVRFEPVLARIPGYSIVRLPFRIVLFAALVLLPLMLMTGRGAVCLGGPEPESMGELFPALRNFYACMLSQPSNLGILAVGTVLFLVATRSERLGAIWHRFLSSIGLRAVS